MAQQTTGPIKSRRAELLEKEQGLQNQRRDERKRRKRLGLRDLPKAVEDHTLVTLVLRLKPEVQSFEGLNGAWFALKKSETLTTYFPKFRYDDTRQTAVARRLIDLGELPMSLGRQIEKELGRFWQKGSVQEAYPTQTLTFSDFDELTWTSKQ